MLIRLAFGVLLITKLQSQAQIQFPRFDVEFKTGITTDFLNSSDWVYNYEVNVNTLNGGINFLLTRNLSAGINYERSIRSTVTYSGDYPGRHFNDLPRYSAGHELVGINIRIASGLRNRIRPYLQLSYMQMKILYNLDSFKVEHFSGAIGLNGGFLIKLSPMIYLNLIDLGLKVPTTKFFGERVDLGQLKTGFVVNFSRVK